MKKVLPYDIIFGVNDTSHFLHSAQVCENKSISLEEFFLKTESKRRWSIINPGYILSNAYMYFVFGYEHNLLVDFPFENFLSQIQIVEIKDQRYNDKDNIQKGKYIQRRLRNSIAHCRYEIEIRTESGKIEKDGDIWFVFDDNTLSGNDYIRFEMPFPVFGNLVENAGKYSMNKLR